MKFFLLRPSVVLAFLISVLLTSCATNPYPALIQENERQYQTGEISRREYHATKAEYIEKNAEFQNTQTHMVMNVIGTAVDVANVVNNFQQTEALNDIAHNTSKPSGPSGGGSKPKPPRGGSKPKPPGGGGGKPKPPR